jgi:hypothetical protein
MKSKVITAVIVAAIILATIVIEVVLYKYNEYIRETGYEAYLQGGNDE